MKKILIAALTFVAAASYADTQSNQGFYIGGGVSGVRNSEDDTKWSPVEVLGGYKLNPWVGGEVRVGASYGGNIKISNYESIYYRTESSNSVGKTYLLLGYTHLDVAGQSADFSFNSLSYGAGVGFVITDRFNLNLEYKVLANAKNTKYSDTSNNNDDVNFKFSSVSATVDYRF